MVYPPLDPQQCLSRRPHDARPARASHARARGVRVRTAYPLKATRSRCLWHELVRQHLTLKLCKCLRQENM
jgi:hypothetical protein